MALFTVQHRIDSRRVHEGHIINLRVDRLRHPEGLETTREVVEHNGGVVIAAQPEPSAVVLVRQYRYSIDAELLELPAGRLESGEEPLPAARRELREETGFEASSWTELGAMYTAPGFCNEILWLFGASGLGFVGKELDEDEETDVITVSLDEAWEMVRRGKVQDAKTLAGLGLLRQERRP